MKSKRILSFLLALMVLTTFFTAFSVTFAATYSGSCGTNVNWTLNTDTGVLSITGSGAMTNYSSYSDVPWYSYRSSIKTVSIGTGVASIGSYAFYNCTGLTSVTIPNSVTSIGTYAFDGCTELTSVMIPDSVTSIGNLAFGYCTKLAAVNVGSTHPNYCSENGILYNKDKTAILCYPAGKTDTSFAIPDSVTSIGSSAFDHCSGLTSVMIPNSVTSIGTYAFYNCSGLSSVTIPNSVTSIGSYAFYFCTSLTSITIPNSVTSIGDDAFSGCTRLTSVTIPNSVTSIGDDAFSGCTRLTSVTIPNSVTSIGDYAFFYCTGLTSITIPNSVTRIGNLAFVDCTKLAAFNVGSTNPNYCSENGVLYNKDKTAILCYPAGKTDASFVIPNSVTSIGSSAFYNCTRLINVTIGNGVASIGKDAFYYCISLQDVTYNGMPNEWKKINIATTGNDRLMSAEIYYAGFHGDCGTNVKWKFSESTGVLSITGSGTMDNYSSSSNVPWYEYRSFIQSVTIGNGVKGIGNYAFSGCTGLTSVTIPNSVTGIGSAAFKGCTGLTGVYITDLAAWCKLSFASSDVNPLYYAKKLYLNGSLVTSLDIPGSVTSIGSYAFYNCTDLTSVTIPNSVTSVGICVFRGCTGLAAINVGGANPNYCSENGVLYNKDKTAILCYPAEKTDTSFVIPNSVKSIESYAFEGCHGLESITIPIDVTSIGNYAFYGCSALKNVSYGGHSGEWGKISIGTNNTPLTSAARTYAYHYKGSCGENVNWTLNTDTGVLSITGFGAMSGYSSSGAPWYSYRSSIKTVSIGTGVTSIGSYAFSGCTGLTSVTIPNSVTSIGNYAFFDCESLTSVTIPDSVTSIGSCAFSDCTGLTSVTLGKKVNSIGFHAFYNCTKITSIGISNLSAWCEYSLRSSFNSSTSLYLYSNGKLLTSFIIPSDVTRIGSSAFYNCVGITSVTIPNSVTSIGDSAFSGCTGLTSITIPGGVKSIGYNAFYHCTRLANVAIRYGVSDIGSRAFEGCYGIQNVMIPNSVKNIGSYAFSGCTGLTSVTIPNSVTNIGDFAFNGCTGLKSATIGNGVKYIGEKAFYGCISFTSAIVGKNIITMGEYAFYNCRFIDVYFAGNEEEWKFFYNYVLEHYSRSPFVLARKHYNYVINDPTSFKDIDSRNKKWYYDAVCYVANNGLFAGSNGKFDPDGNMTRGMFVSVLARMAGVNVNNNATTKFSDVKKGQWYTGAVKWASDNGIVTGSYGRFMPNDPITREQICSILVTYSKFMKITLKANTKAVTFKDAKKISSWAKSAVATCQKAGLIAGTNGNFDPKGKATRAAVAQILMKFDQNFGK